MMCEEAGVSCNVHWHIESCCAPDTFQWVRQGRQPRPWKATLPTIEHIHHNETAKFSEFEHLWSPIPQETVSSWPAGPAAGILPSTQAESPDRDAAIPGELPLRFAEVLTHIGTLAQEMARQCTYKWRLNRCVLIRVASSMKKISGSLAPIDLLRLGGHSSPPG